MADTKISALPSAGNLTGAEFAGIQSGSNLRFGISLFNAAYQAVLVSGTNIKTVNGSSLLGNGNIELYSGFSKITVGTSAPGAPATGDLWIDTN